MNNKKDDISLPFSNERKKYEKMGYRFVGKNKHTAIKVCEWCRKSLGEKGFCYKQKWYGIKSHECIQMSPTIFSCNQNCLFCWRVMRFSAKPQEKWDEPKDIADGCIEEQKKILQGFGGNPNTDKKKMWEAEHPKQVAISLAGEPTIYPMLGGLINEFHSRKMTTFLVSNGTLPDRIKQLLDDNTQPTQMYITLAGPNEKIYRKTVLPMQTDSWERLQKSLSLLSNFNRSVIRLTLAKDLNMSSPEEYAKIIDSSGPKYLEVKGFMSIGGARERIPFDSMPKHEEVVRFAEQIERSSSYKIKDEKVGSRVILMER
ncbi:4-demethylwyosine synthase TYW1 [Candidatus Aenigmatarchaeota archaeon]